MSYACPLCSPVHYSYPAPWWPEFSRMRPHQSWPPPLPVSRVYLLWMTRVHHSSHSVVVYLAHGDFNTQYSRNSFMNLGLCEAIWPLYIQIQSNNTLCNFDARKAICPNLCKKINLAKGNLPPREAIEPQQTNKTFHERRENKKKEKRKKKKEKRKKRKQ